MPIFCVRTNVFLRHLCSNQCCAHLLLIMHSRNKMCNMRSTGELSLNNSFNLREKEEIEGRGKGYEERSEKERRREGEGERGETEREKRKERGGKVKREGER